MYSVYTRFLRVGVANVGFYSPQTPLAYARNSAHARFHSNDARVSYNCCREACTARTVQCYSSAFALYIRSAHADESIAISLNPCIMWSEHRTYMDLTKSSLYYSKKNEEFVLIVHYSCFIEPPAMKEMIL